MGAIILLILLAVSVGISVREPRPWPWFMLGGTAAVFGLLFLFASTLSSDGRTTSMVAGLLAMVGAAAAFTGGARRMKNPSKYGRAKGQLVPRASSEEWATQQADDQDAPTEPSFS